MKYLYIFVPMFMLIQNFNPVSNYFFKLWSYLR